VLPRSIGESRISRIDAQVTSPQSEDEIVFFQLRVQSVFMLSHCRPSDTAFRAPRRLDGDQ
jgi:hypothetical protein